MNEQADQLPYPVLGDRFTDAFAHAVRLHARQARKDTTISYLTHLMAVCSLVLEDGGDEDQAIAALLHDGPEDQGGQPVLDEIRKRFGDEVANLVDGLSDTLDLENLDYNEFEASFDSVTLALASHMSALAPYRER